MRATITLEDSRDGGVHMDLVFSEPVSDDTKSQAVRAAMLMVDALGKSAKIDNYREDCEDERGDLYE